jgi:hypothetical protein
MRLAKNGWECMRTWTEARSVTVHVCRETNRRHRVCVCPCKLTTPRTSDPDTQYICPDVTTQLARANTKETA